MTQPAPDAPKHTPGPWAIRRKSWPMDIRGRIHQVANSAGYPTAFVPAWDNPGPGEIDGAEEALANARLIASAPEMLQALKALMKALPGHWDAEDAPGGAEAWKAAEGAIAEAEGRS